MTCSGTRVCAHISVCPFCLQVSNYTAGCSMHTASAVLVWQQHALPVTEFPVNNPVLWGAMWNNPVPCCFLHVLCSDLRALSLCMCRNMHLQHLFSAKKLLLVLDLDHTLLSSTRMADLPEEMLPKAEALLSEQKPGHQLLFKLPHMWMWTKLRPGIHKFLAEAHKLFELHIYTHGDQDYAAEMAKLLDPKRTLFGGRVISAVRSQPFQICLYSKSSIKNYQQDPPRKLCMCCKQKSVACQVVCLCMGHLQHTLLGPSKICTGMFEYKGHRSLKAHAQRQCVVVDRQHSLTCLCVVVERQHPETCQKLGCGPGC